MFLTPDDDTSTSCQAMDNPELCGEVPDHATLQRFLHDLFGQSPASLWANLLQEVSEETLLWSEPGRVTVMKCLLVNYYYLLH